MVAELWTAAAVVLAVAAEQLHAARTRRLAGLAFGPGGKPAVWTVAAPILRTLAIAALCWGLITLLLLPPKSHKLQGMKESDYRHLVLMLDVSPSMRLKDGGPTGKQTRAERAADLLKSFFERAPIALYKISVVAFYTEAKPVVVDTTDMEIVRNILSDLPLHYAFKSGPTDMFAGLNEVAKLARPWRPGSTTLMIVSDGDSIPPTGMPKMPVSVAHTLVCGVGDATVGRFIAGHQSRQDSSMLRQAAARLAGSYHNGNEKNIPTDLLVRITQMESESVFKKLTKREYALIACAVGASLLALLPILLQQWGSAWRPGVPAARRSASEISRSRTVAAAAV